MVEPECDVVILSVIVAFIGAGLYRRVNVHDVFVEGRRAEYM